ATTMPPHPVPEIFACGPVPPAALSVPLTVIVVVALAVILAPGAIVTVTPGSMEIGPLRLLPSVQVSSEVVGVAAAFGSPPAGSPGSVAPVPPEPVLPPPAFEPPPGAPVLVPPVSPPDGEPSFAEQPKDAAANIATITAAARAVPGRSRRSFRMPTLHLSVVRGGVARSLPVHRRVARPWRSARCAP